MTAVEPKIDTITVHNPADGRVAGSVPIDGPETVAAKARRLRPPRPSGRPSARAAARSG